MPAFVGLGCVDFMRDFDLGGGVFLPSFLSVRVGVEIVLVSTLVATRKVG